jgi:hypothetical protein
MMPYWAEKVGVPRALAVEFPFAQTLGRSHDAAQQRRVILQALEVLESASEPGRIVHSEERWPQEQAEAIRDWQPSKPSPIIREMAPKIRALLREQRRRGRPQDHK